MNSHKSSCIKILLLLDLKICKHTYKMNHFFINSEFFCLKIKYYICSNNEHLTVQNLNELITWKLRNQVYLILQSLKLWFHKN